MNCVAIGSGCALLPDYLQCVTRAGIEYRPLRPPNIVKAMVIVKEKGQGRTRLGVLQVFSGHPAFIRSGNARPRAKPKALP